jgi:acetyltransferase-like isoleucine patch superfamily enzyme
MKKKFFCYVIRPILLNVSGLFFSKQFLKGRYFDYSLIGWKKVLRSLLTQKVFGYNSKVKWPVSPFIAIDDPSNIFFHPDDMNNFWHFGCYYSNVNGGKITLGHGTWIAPNVGIITTNHSKSNLNFHDLPKDVIIGSKCWIGMNSVILPGVRLGNNTIVGAGSIVTKSFPDGNCVIGGNPARIIKRL